MKDSTRYSAIHMDTFSVFFNINCTFLVLCSNIHIMDPNNIKDFNCAQDITNFILWSKKSLLFRHLKFQKGSYTGPLKQFYVQAFVLKK